METPREAARGRPRPRAPPPKATAVSRELNPPPDPGLPPEEAAARLTRYGPNELAEAPRPGVWRMLLAQFDNFIVLVLIAAAAVSNLLGDYLEGAAILAIVVLNAVLGVVQERRGGGGPAGR